MSLGQTSKPRCGPVSPPESVPTPVRSIDEPRRSRGGGESGWAAAVGSRPQVDSSPAGIWDPRGGGGAGGIWNTLRRQRGQLVNFVGMHLVERRCINIRSLSADCVSRLGGGGAGGPQMPFVKKTRMAPRRPRKVTTCQPVALRVRAQDPREGRGDWQHGRPRLCQGRTVGTRLKAEQEPDRVGGTDGASWYGGGGTALSL